MVGYVAAFVPMQYDYRRDRYRDEDEKDYRKDRGDRDYNDRERDRGC